MDPLGMPPGPIDTEPEAPDAWLMSLIYSSALGPPAIPDAYMPPNLSAYGCENC